jgi:Fe-S oxidoreductase
MRRIAEEASELVRKYKGAYSGEHGDGLCRGEWIQWQFGPAITSAFGEIKRLFDPLELLSPNRIVDPPRMDDTRLMRFPPSYKVIPLQPALDWSGWNVQNDPATEQVTAPGTGGDPAEGFAKAVEMCNNNGHCRKFDAGTMCPSYRVTRDEQHLTRGRANTLRLALSGQLDPPRPSRGGTGGGGSHMTDPWSEAALTAVREALDLCVSCKGCKRDCPTGVDMARMKIEFLHADRQKNGWSIRDRLVAHLPDYAAVASRFASLLNLRNRSGLLARLGEKALGFSAQRSLPEWQSRHFFNSGVRGATREEVLAAAQPVVLFVDTFNGFFESANAQAAFDVLQAAGYTVHVAAKQGGDGRHLCCGRTFLAGGMVEKAKAKAGELLDALSPFVERGIAVVGLEPSCLLTLRDEMTAMGFGERAQALARQSLLLEEFLAREAGAGRLDVLRAKLRPLDQPVLVHGHCHQKAFGAVSPVLEVLKLIPGVSPQLIESSCCGMAGSFGYEARHHAVSMQMAELSLLPAVRAAPDAVVVADGTSCRHQIQDGARREAIHAAVLLARQL